jgi:hypothetical protein
MLKKPWLAAVLVMLPAVATAQSSESRLETGLFFTFAKLERIGSNDHEAGTSTAGLGGRIAWRLLPYVDIDGELSVHPRAGVSGYRIQGLLGTKVGVWFGRLGLFAKARPGFLYFEKDPFGVGVRGSTFPHTEWADSVEPALDLGASIQFAAPNGLLFRVDIGDTIVRYNARTVATSPTLPARVEGNFTTRNCQWSMGLGTRF